MSEEFLLARPVWRLLFWTLVVAVSVLMLVPQPPSSLDTGWDKLNHALAFAAVTFAGLAGLGRPGARRGAALALAVLAWGGGLEVLQGLLPPRSAEAADLLADAVGVVVGGAAYGLATRILRRPVR